MILDEAAWRLQLAAVDFVLDHQARSHGYAQPGRRRLDAQVKVLVIGAAAALGRFAASV
ncbi:hypothetical protein D3C77_680400 [compost metagenome]